jgi:hypothetical protein
MAGLEPKQTRRPGTCSRTAIFGSEPWGRADTMEKAALSGEG